MQIFSSTNEPGLYFVQTPERVLEDYDREAYAFRPVSFPALADYAAKKSVSGFIWLEMQKQPEGYYLPVIPQD